MLFGRGDLDFSRGRAVKVASATRRALVRPGAEELAMAFYESVALELRQTLAVFVDVAEPHANDCLGAGVPEAVDELGVVQEMIIQHGPLSGNRFLHDDEPPGWILVRVLVPNRTIGLGPGYDARRPRKIVHSS